MTAHDEHRLCDFVGASRNKRLDPARSALLVRMACAGLLSACSGASSTNDASGGAQAAGGSATASTGGNTGGGAVPSSGGASAGGSGGTAGKDGVGGPSGGKSSASSGGLAGAGSGSGSITCRHDGDGKTTLVFVNRCAQALTFSGSDIESGNVEPGGHQCVDIGSDSEALSAKRYWGFIGADPGAERHSLAEFTFNTDFNDFDWYNISYVDAFNLPLQIVPVARTNCKTLTCADDFISGCPEVGQYKDASGRVVACVSPNRNDGNSPVARYFEDCDDAYAWSGDDQNGSDPSPVRACAGEDWDIVFCPQGSP